MAEGDKKFGHINRADDVAGLVSFGEESGGDDGAPAPSSDGVEEPSGEGEGDGSGGAGVDGEGFVVGAPKDVAAHEDEITANPRFQHFAREIGKKVGAGDAPQHSGNTQFEEEGFVDVLVEEMADAAHARGENFRDFDRVADEGGSGAESEEKGGAGDAVGHAEGAVDNLARQSDEDGDEEDRGHDDTIG